MTAVRSSNGEMERAPGLGAVLPHLSEKSGLQSFMKGPGCTPQICSKDLAREGAFPKGGKGSLASRGSEPRCPLPPESSRRRGRVKLLDSQREGGEGMSGHNRPSR